MSDTYEPGSTFKILTTAAALEKGVVKMTDRFHCPGYKIVEDRRIRCHKKGGHGSETFLDGIMNRATRFLLKWVHELVCLTFFPQDVGFWFDESDGD